MGEGAAIFLLKRLADAERDGDKIYAVLRGIGGVQRRQGQRHYGSQSDWPEAGHRTRLAERRIVSRSRHPDRRTRHLDPRGRSGRNAEHDGRVQQLPSPSRFVALGSVKSNIGHLKGAAGAAGLLKAVLALHEKVLPPSVNGEQPQSRYRFCARAVLS